MSGDLYAEPVATELGEAMRQRAVAILAGRYAKLAEDSKRYSFSPIEQTVMAATGRALEVLQAMAPVGALEPANAKAWFGKP